jgi:hypothetical protein
VPTCGVLLEIKIRFLVDSQCVPLFYDTGSNLPEDSLTSQVFFSYVQLLVRTPLNVDRNQLLSFFLNTCGARLTSYLVKIEWHGEVVDPGKNNLVRIIRKSIYAFRRCGQTIGAITSSRVPDCHEEEGDMAITVTDDQITRVTFTKE